MSLYKRIRYSTEERRNRHVTVTVTSKQENNKEQAHGSQRDEGA
jgi:hypothetical protein